uniref:MerR n=3 Tax=Enterobacteriaceae TaxID=543 RepID=A0A2R4PGG2_ECOLX|nr:MerR [Klebsiella pneumoniae]AKN19272.1 MerR [Salmonella enterica subsp. enterica serovar Corvallis]AVX50731.1 MerR [Escherichia coli]
MAFLPRRPGSTWRQSASISARACCGNRTKPYGSIRRYGEADVVRVKFVKSAQRLGFSLDEIAELLRLDDGTHCEEASSLAEHKLKDVREKMADLARMETVLSELVCACHARKGNVSCPLIASLQGEAGLARSAMP